MVKIEYMQIETDSRGEIEQKVQGLLDQYGLPGWCGADLKWMYEDTPVSALTVDEKHSYAERAARALASMMPERE